MSNRILTPPAMSWPIPECDHGTIGRALASSYSRASEALHIIELVGGKVEGLNLEQWQAIRSNYLAEMESNLAHHRARCLPEGGSK